MRRRLSTILSPRSPSAYSGHSFPRPPRSPPARPPPSSRPPTGAPAGRASTRSPTPAPRRSPAGASSSTCRPARRVGSYWDALLTSSGNHHTFANREYNGALAPGASATFGFLGSGSGSPLNCRVNGADCGGGGDPQPGVPGAPGGARVTGTTASSITLGWNAASGTVTGYRVYEGTALRTTVTGTSPRSAASPRARRAPTRSPRTTRSASPPAARRSPAPRPAASRPTCRSHFLTGYWHNFVNPATELRLSAVPDEYDLVAVAFAEATATPGAVTFGVDPGLSTALGGYTNDQFKADVATLKSRGKKVILSVGGEAGRVSVGDVDVGDELREQRAVDHDRVRLRRRRHRPGERAQPDLHGSGAADPAQPGRLEPDHHDGPADHRHAVHRRLVLRAGAEHQGHPHGRAHAVLQLRLDARLRPVGRLRPGQRSTSSPRSRASSWRTGCGPTRWRSACRPARAPPAAAWSRRRWSTTRSTAWRAAPTAARSARRARIPDIRGAMTWSINWDVTNGNNFARTVAPHLDTLP